LGPAHPAGGGRSRPADSAEPAVEEARARVVARLRSWRLETDAAIFARVRDLAPGAAGLEDAEYMAGLRTAVAAALEYVLEGIERGENEGSPPNPPTPGIPAAPAAPAAPPTPAIPAATLEQARRAARTGVGLETVLRRYVAGLAILEGFVVQAAEQQEQDLVPATHVLRDVLANMAALVDRLIAAVSRAYGEELEGADHPPPPPARASPGRAVEPRRERILQAMVEVAGKHGFENTTVALLTGRAGVSTRTFYEEFDGLQECFLAVLDLALERAGGLIAQAAPSCSPQSPKARRGSCRRGGPPFQAASCSVITLPIPPRIRCSRFRRCRSGPPCFYSTAGRFFHRGSRRESPARHNPSPSAR
jgi:Bacterial regulatory proteins, tetR family